MREVMGCTTEDFEKAFDNSLISFYGNVAPLNSIMHIKRSAKRLKDWMRQYNVIDGKPMPFNSKPDAAYRVCMQRTCTHPYHLPPGYHYPDNLPEGHPGHYYPELPPYPVTIP
jgi:hypothetical protein